MGPVALGIMVILFSGYVHTLLLHDGKDTINLWNIMRNSKISVLIRLMILKISTYSFGDIEKWYFFTRFLNLSATSSLSHCGSSTSMVSMLEKISCSKSNSGFR